MKTKLIYYVATGISAAKIVNEQTDAEIINWLYNKYDIIKKA